jgi:phosphoglycolate phosphatase-like HAD superfamily hydrolase
MFSRFTGGRSAGLGAFFWVGFLVAAFFVIRQFYAWDMGRPDVLLLDIDGTLVDNTSQHIAAWREAFSELGLAVDDETLRRHIGKGGDLYVKAVAGEGWDRRHGDQARERHGQAYQRRLAEVRPVEGVTEFLAGLHQLGIRSVLATSSNPNEVAGNLRVVGERPEHFLIVDRDDIETSKPAPDVFAVALLRSGAEPDQARAVGDTRWDGESASKIGVAFWGVLTGAGTEEELRQAGAQQVFRTLATLLEFVRRV